jgi:hypothetical protein
MDADQEAKKNVAARTPPVLHRFDSDPMTTVFPVPAGPATYLIFPGRSTSPSLSMI